jgi:hypothetical protein
MGPRGTPFNAIFGFCLLIFVLLAADAGGGAPPAVLALFAGDMRGVGAVDGTGAAASFSNPQGVATDSAGNVYVADRLNHTIRKITPAGVVTTLAGTAGIRGSADGTGAAARFNFPNGVATDSASNIYVADAGNSTIRKITPAGEVTTLAGTAGVDGSTDGTGAAARFTYPAGIATDSAGNVYVVDTGTIRKITPAGVVATFAGTAGVEGSTDGTGAAARFAYPTGVATDSAGNVYVADMHNHTIRKITPAGVVSTLAGKAGVEGSTDGTGAAARFAYPTDVATDSAGNVYVSSASAIRKITPAGVVSTLAGTAGIRGSADGTGAAARFRIPRGVAVDSAGNVYVADGLDGTIRKITPAGVVTTLAGTAGVIGSTDGTGAVASFDSPSGVATDSAGNVYVVDWGNSTIREITPAGAVSTLAGTAGIRGSTDGTRAAASFNSPRGVATDSARNVYVADTHNHTIRKITPAGVVSTLAGRAGIHGSTDGTGAAARFTYPTGVATDSAGNLYVADWGNSTIRKITPAGVVTTLAGTARVRGSTDGTGTAASFDSPNGIATDSAGNVYVTDALNGTIRKITPAGVVTTLAGTAGIHGSTDGTGAAASFNSLNGVATDSAGNVYVADNFNYTIRKITPAGMVSTVVGVAGQAGFMPGALPGRLVFPVVGVAVSGPSLYITLRNGVAVVQNRP